MLLQRLVVDSKSGFNYDYMGYAEFEFGATRTTRIQLAKLQIKGEFSGKKVRFFEKWGRSTTGPIDVFVFGSKQTINDLGIAPPPGTNVPYDLVLTTDKSSAQFDNEKIIGWMSVHTNEPLLIVRANQENIERGNKFLQSFIDGILQEERNAEKQEVFRYTNGWTLRRTHGPIVLPQNNNIPIEAGGQWVLFDEKGSPIGRDKYFTDITERYQRQIGNPIPTEN